MRLKQLVAMLRILNVKIAKARINGIPFVQFAALTSTIQLLHSANVQLEYIILKRISAAPNYMMLIPRPAFVRLELTMINRTLVAHHLYAATALPQIPGTISWVDVVFRVRPSAITVVAVIMLLVMSLAKRVVFALEL